MPSLDKMKRVEAILQLDERTIETLYTVEIFEGTVYDPIEDRDFDSVRDWAESWVDAEDATPGVTRREPMGRSQRFGYDE